MDRIFLAIIVSGMLVILTATSLLVFDKNGPSLLRQP
jgi:hypothetical protein